MTFPERLDAAPTGDELTAVLQALFGVLEQARDEQRMEEKQ